MMTLISEGLRYLLWPTADWVDVEKLDTDWGGRGEDKLMRLGVQQYLGDTLGPGQACQVRTPNSMMLQGLFSVTSVVSSLETD